MNQQSQQSSWRPIENKLNCYASKYLSILAGVLVLLAGADDPSLAASRLPVSARSGMVVSSDRFASEIGVQVLKAGGNAVDAAVAVGFALAVTHPSAGNLGGGGFMMIRQKSGETTCIDYREVAPSIAHEKVYLDAKGNIKAHASTRGFQASGVPGTVAGLCLAQSRFGRLSLTNVIRPAIRLAEDGFRVSNALSESLKQAQDILGEFAESRRIFLRNGNLFQSSELLRQPDLAWSLKQIRYAGADAFYRGKIAKRIAGAYKSQTGWISEEDLRSYQPKFREVLKGSYRDYRIITMPPPSSGGAVLLEILNTLETLPVGEMGAGSSKTIHLVAEAMRRAFRDRAQLMGDTDFIQFPLARLVSKSYAAELRRSIDFEKASDSLSLPGRLLPRPEATETTHYSVVDAAGNAVSNTYTLNGSYGSGMTVEGTGILMNNEMDDFTSKPGVPNAFNLIQGEANKIEPGKRPLSAMSPTFLVHNNSLFLVIGSPGGPTIINTVLQVILNIVDFGFTIQESIDAPRFHHQWLPDELRLETRGFSADVVAALQRLGHHVVTTGFIGEAQGIMIDPATGVRLGASDPRGDGLAVGY